MPDVWFPGAIRDPGRQANYRSGRCRSDVDVAHETVGHDSRALLRDSGLSWILFPKVGPPIQFCPCDATTAHACEWNTGGAGHEVERIPGEPFTADQVHWIGEVVRWRHEQWGVVLAHHAKEEGRLPIGSPWRGTADHGGLVHHACDQHTDGWSAAEWAAVTASTGGGAPPPRKQDEMPTIVIPTDGNFTGRNFLVEAYTRPDGVREVGITRVSKDKGAAPYWVSPEFYPMATAGCEVRPRPNSETERLPSMPAGSTIGGGGSGGGGVAGPTLDQIVSGVLAGLAMHPLKPS